MSKKKKKKTKKDWKRNKAKHPALDPQYNPKNRREYVDYDYTDDLSDEEKDFLNKFTEEYYGASFKHDDRDIHQGYDQKKDSYDRNNARNRCLYSGAKANNLLSDNKDVEFICEEFEDLLIESIDQAQQELLEPSEKTIGPDENGSEGSQGDKGDA